VSTEASAAIGVVVVDDDAQAREDLRQCLARSPDIAIVGEAADGLEALAVARRTQPDLVLMDLRMPRCDGLEASRMLLSRARAAGLRRGPKVIVLTSPDTEAAHVLEALRIGASGFIAKDTSPARLLAAVHAVLAGEPMLSPHAIAHLLAGAPPTNGSRVSVARERLAALTDREHELALAIGRGLSDAEIAEELSMSLANVTTQIPRLYAKLGVSNRVQVALTVHDAGLA
jgi:DNA-binding NarL/FixJ family response regulator